MKLKAKIDQKKKKKKYNRNYEFYHQQVSIG